MFSFLKNVNLGFLNPLGAGDDYVALDIGSSSIKLVETVVDKNGYRVLSLGILPLPEYAIQNNMVVDSKPVVEIIRKLIHENGVKSKQVISAVPGRAVIMKKVQMPKQEPAELEANIEFEAQNVIPENLENVNLDHQVLQEVGRRQQDGRAFGRGQEGNRQQLRRRDPRGRANANRDGRRLLRIGKYVRSQLRR